MSNKTEIYYIVKAKTNDEETKYVEINPENFDTFGYRIEDSRKPKFCLTFNKDRAEVFTDESYVTKDIGSFKENIREKGEIASLYLVEVTEEVVVNTSYNQKEILWEKKTED